MSVSGLPTLRFLRDNAVAKNGDWTENRWASDIAFSDVPNVVYAVFEETLYESRDAGCTWSARIAVPVNPDDPMATIAYVRAGSIYVYTRDKLWRVVKDAVTSAPLPERLRTLVVDPHDPLHLRAVAAYGNAYESTDGGATWNRIGGIPDAITVYNVTFDPFDLNHAIAGVVSRTQRGVVITHDGGRTWTAPIRVNDGRNIVFEVEFSPVDSRIVWVQADESLYRSDDGAKTFILTAPTIAAPFLMRGPIAPHPYDPNVVAVSTSAGVLRINSATRSGSLVTVCAPRAAAWSPSGVLYFSSPDAVWVANSLVN